MRCNFLITFPLFLVASAILQGGLFGLVGKFPSRYITAVVSGQALGGIFAAGVEIITLSGGAGSKTSALLYFLIAILILVLSLISYMILSKSVKFIFNISYFVYLLKLHIFEF